MRIICQSRAKILAEGKFFYTKDPNRQPVYRFGFRIEGTKLVSAPKNYEDVLEYANNLFVIVNYNMQNNSTKTENNYENIDDISDITGKKLNIAPHKGYTAVIATAELDIVDMVKLPLYNVMTMSI